MIGVYPVALFVLFFGVLFFDWMAEAAESEPQDIQSFSDRDVDDILERLGINDIDDDIFSEVDDIDVIGTDEEDPDQLESDTDTGDTADEIKDEDVDDIEDNPEQEAEEEPDSEQEEETVNYYYYSVLSESDKKLYSEFQKAMEDLSNKTRVMFSNEKEAERMYYLVKGDHPEYFYVNGFEYSNRTDGISVIPVFSYDEGEIISYRAMNEEAVSEILDRMPGGMGEYEIIRYCYEWIVNNTDYLLGCPDNQEMISVFLNHESVCAGYTRAMQYLLQKCNMQAMYVGGFAAGRHAWLIVQVDGQYYNLDVTWADNTIPEVPHPDYAYLLLSTEKISHTHTVNTDIYPAPNCTAMDSNFYVMENLYIKDLDDDVLQEVFDRSKLQYNGTVYMMASDAGMYRALVNYLIKEGNVYRLYYGEFEHANINYYNNDDLYTLSFYK